MKIESFFKKLENDGDDTLIIRRFGERRKRIRNELKKKTKHLNSTKHCILFFLLN